MGRHRKTTSPQKPNSPPKQDSSRTMDQQEVMQELRDLKTEIETLVKTVEDLKSRLNEKDKRIEMLENRIEDMEKYQKRNNIILSGSPEDLSIHTYSHVAAGEKQEGEQHQKDRNEEQEAIEDLERPEEEVMKDKFIKFAEEKLKLQIRRDEISAIHKLRKRKDGIEPVIIRFTNSSAKRQVMSNRKELKGTKIYINEQLTKKTAELEKAVRRLRKDKKLCSTWTYNGRLFVKKTEHSTKKEIKHFEEIQDYM